MLIMLIDYSVGNTNGSGENRLEAADIRISNLLKNARYPVMLCRYTQAKNTFDHNVMIRFATGTADHLKLNLRSIYARGGVPGLSRLLAVFLR